VQGTVRARRCPGDSGHRLWTVGFPDEKKCIIIQKVMSMVITSTRRCDIHG